MRMTTELVLMLARKVVFDRRRLLAPLPASHRRHRSTSSQDGLLSIPSTPPPEPGRELAVVTGGEVKGKTGGGAKIKIVRPVPSDAYLKLSALRSTKMHARTSAPLIVLDLNNTLLFRREKSARGSKKPVPRPHLVDFFRYVGATDTHGVKNWEAYVYSSARRKNVLAMLDGVGIRRHIARVFAREDMGLTDAEYHSNIETVKDLDLIWQASKWTARDTILLDDEPVKASKQPHNLLKIDAYEFDDDNDEALLDTIARLEAIRLETNFASFLRERDSTKRTSLVEQGREIVSRLGARRRPRARS